MLEVARVEVDPEARAVADRRQRLARGHEVVGDLGRVDLEREAHALGLEDVDDRPPALGELLVAALDLGEVVGRERVEQVPDRRAGEAGDDLDAELRRPRARCPSSARRRAARTPSGSPSPHTSGGSTPWWRASIGSHTAWPTRWLPIAQQPSPWRSSSSRRPGAVAAGRDSACGDVEVIAPAGELEPVEAPLRRTCAASSSSGRSAHWPVNSVTGRAMSFHPSLVACRRTHSCIATGRGRRRVDRAGRAELADVQHGGDQRAGLLGQARALLAEQQHAALGQRDRRRSAPSPAGCRRRAAAAPRSAAQAASVVDGRVVADVLVAVGDHRAAAVPAAVADDVHLGGEERVGVAHDRCRC